MIHKPGHAQGVELLIKELHPLQEKIRLTSNTPGKHPPKHTSISQLHLGDSSPSFLFFSFLAKVYSPLQAHASSSYSPDSLTGPSDTVRALTPGHRTHQLSSQQGHVLNDGQPHSPLGIFSQLHNGRQQGLGQLSDANHLIHAVQVGDDVQPHLRALRRRQGSEKMHLAQNRAKTVAPHQLCRSYTSGGPATALASSTGASNMGYYGRQLFASPQRAKTCSVVPKDLWESLQKHGALEKRDVVTFPLCCVPAGSPSARDSTPLAIHL